MPAKRSSKKIAKQPSYRLKDIADEQMTEAQRALRDAIFSGPRGKRPKLNGPFAIWLHAPQVGMLAQALGAHCRFKTALSPRHSELAILTTGQFWRAQYEWYAHAPMAERAGVKPATIRDIKAGRVPKGAPKDERALYDFIKELYRTRRVSDRTYARAHKILGDAAMIEFVAILGYYVLISMTLNVFRAQVPEDAELPFRESA